MCRYVTAVGTAKNGMDSLDITTDQMTLLVNMALTNIMAGCVSATNE